MSQEDNAKPCALHSNPKCDQKWLKVDLQVTLFGLNVLVGSTRFPWPVIV